MDGHDQLVNDILAVIPDANPLWIDQQVSLHLSVDPIPLHARARILDSAFKIGYVKVDQNPRPLAEIAALPPLPVAPPLPLPPPTHAAQPSSARAAGKRKAPERAPASSTAKKQALSVRVDYTQTQRPPSHQKDSWYRDLSIKYLTVTFANLPLH
jgi:hypothetical protein